MTKFLHLYIDESGSRRPNLDPTKEHNPKWFGMGGILFNEEDKIALEKLHEEFFSRHFLCKNTIYLHSHEIRHKKGNFSFLKEIGGEKYKKFIEDLSDTLVQMPVIGIGCVIDQEGYHNRYQDKYRQDIWWLCKTAFSICVERAIKYACLKERKLKVNVERSDPITDQRVKTYYEDMKNNGMPFADENMKKYSPLNKQIFKENLYDFSSKQKKSISMQIADLFLYSLCRGGYEKNYLPYKILEDNQKLINQQVDISKIGEMGIKYSCFENR